MIKGKAVFFLLFSFFHLKTEKKKKLKTNLNNLAGESQDKINAIVKEEVKERLKANNTFLTLIFTTEKKEKKLWTRLWMKLEMVASITGTESERERKRELIRDAFWGYSQQFTAILSIVYIHPEI